MQSISVHMCPKMLIPDEYVNYFTGINSMIIIHRDSSVDTSLESGRCVSNSIDVTSGHTADPTDDTAWWPHGH